MTNTALPAAPARKNRNIGGILFVLAVLMVGAAYAAVPLYYAFCAATGYGGTTRNAAGNPKGVIARQITVRFDANVDDSLPWQITPAKPVTDRIGSVETIEFTARNLSDHAITGQAAFNVTPDLAGSYFNKIQCFCFTQQTLKPGETVQMPVTFFVDPDIDKNSDLSTVSDITLSYTFYASKTKGKLIMATAAATASSGHAKPHHDYHLVKPSPWPIVGSVSAFILAIGGILFMRHVTVWVLLIGAAGVLYTMYAWWTDVVHEAQEGDHTPVVRMHHRYGMLLFIASEVMFFVAWFWAYFDQFFRRADPEQYARVQFMGPAWPPNGVELFNPFHLPLFNTLLLLCSGTTVTWAHHALIQGDRKGLRYGLMLTIALGLCFTCVQAIEYSRAGFSYSGDIYGAAFFMATGFHGFHVVIGTIFLIVCLLRANAGQFTVRHHLGFEFAAWYWHFVDVVWLFLFASIYVWGAWGVANLG